MITKICSKCGLELSITEFHKDSKGKYGVRKECKQCTSIRHKKYSRDKYKIWQARHEIEGAIIYWKRRASKMNDKIFKRYGIEEKICGEDLHNKFSSINFCFYCGEIIKHNNCNIEHIIPLSIGGANNINNVVFSCGRCNRTKGNKTDIEFFQYIKKIYLKLKEKYD